MLFTPILLFWSSLKKIKLVTVSFILNNTAIILQGLESSIRRMSMCVQAYPRIYVSMYQHTHPKDTHIYLYMHNTCRVHQYINQHNAMNKQQKK